MGCDRRRRTSPTHVQIDREGTRSGARQACRQAPAFGCAASDIELRASMILKTRVRRVATLVLQAANRLGPHDTHGWGRAMLRELEHVEGDWTAVLWAFGGASVLMKRAFASLFIPFQRQHATLSHEALLAEEASIRKRALVTCGGCFLAVLLFVAAPSFRQALPISLAPWRVMFHADSRNGEPGLESLAKKAEAHSDSEGLVFAAVRLADDRGSARLAEEAVDLDPNLLWVYAMIAVRHPHLPEINRWVPKLEQWDPGNALPYLIAAESIDIGHVSRASTWPQPKPEADEEWRRAMTAAFESAEIDNYLGRLKEIDRRVVSRYGLNDPSVVLAGEEQGLPTYAYYDARRFAASLRPSDKALGTRDDGGVMGLLLHVPRTRRDAYGWRAAMVQTSGATLLVFGGLTAICVLTLLVHSSRPRFAGALSLISAIGLFLSASTLYAAYRPYSRIFERIILNGDVSRTKDLTSFLNQTQMLLGVKEDQTFELVFHLWLGVTLLAVMALLFMFLRHFLKRPPASV